MGILENIVLSVLLIGNTHYVDVGQEADAVIYYESTSVAHMTLPGQDAWRGVMKLNDSSYHVAWEDGPEGEWKIRHEDGAFIYVGPDGADAGTVTKIVPGNPENY